ncbi:hypothetical protein AC578_7459 [Pseudocercospora eumusae]|uniref:Peptidase M12A domain-containing protein n=1 Tax=Pseudocercospora eumusae TaxID=321146 RepID=A0A139H916_9PEZI|nr:hypothetical protein AC578_7459 [Pseudocercospora eumusae]
MGLRLLATALLLLGLVVLAAACPPLEDPDQSSNLEKRYWAVSNPRRVPKTGAPWPFWPPGQTDRSVVRYCFATEAALQALGNHMDEAIKLWEPAFAVSTLEIQPYGRYPAIPLCNDGSQLPADILRINTRSDGVCLSSGVGYVPEPPSPGELGNEIQCDPASGPHMAQSLAHELGHQFGLQHEHQRADAAKYVEFNCYLHPEYPQWQQMIAEKRQPMYRDGDTVDSICYDYITALRYRASSAQYMPEPGWSDETAGGRIGSREFDYTSIMIYPSFQGPAAGRDLYRAFLVGYSQTNPEKIWEIAQGREQADPIAHTGPWSEFRVSPGDIEGIKRLYPIRLW